MERRGLSSRINAGSGAGRVIAFRQLHRHAQRAAARDHRDLVHRVSLGQLAEFLHDRRPAQALRLIDALFRQGTRTAEIVAALAGQIERWKKGVRQLDAGRALAEIAQDLRVPVFFQESFFRRLKTLSKERLDTLTEALLVCDESFKSGQAEERLALEKLIWTT